MRRQALLAVGHSLILASPVLVLVETISGRYGLTFVALILVAPLLRSLFGDARHEPPSWSEGLATYLEFLPAVAAIACIFAVAMSMGAVPRGANSAAGRTLLGLSLWALFVFASCIAHELVHRRDSMSRMVGQVLSGVIGYPVLEHEHRAHHARSGNVSAAEWPRLDESVWTFSVRRLRVVFRNAWESDLVAASKKGKRLAGGLPLSSFAMAATAAAFAAVSGLRGLVLYCVVAIAVAWSMQAVTYVQHWGLGTDSVDIAVEGEYGWEDHCVIQSWMTLAISYHQAHHHNSLPYYRQRPTGAAPKAPAGYVVLLLASLIPPMWRSLMIPALDRWKADPNNQATAGRRLVCIVR